MHRRLLPPLLLVPALLQAQVSPPSTGCTEPRAACAEFERMLDALNRRDWPTFRASLDENVVAFLDRPASGERRDGRAEVEAMFRRLFPPEGAPPAPVANPIRPEKLIAMPLGEAVVITFQFPDGDLISRRTVVLRKTGSAWRVVHIHGSSGPRPGAPAASAAPAPTGVRAQFFPSADSARGTLPFSEAVQVGPLLFVSGQIGVAPGTLDPVPGGMAAEARQAMENIRAILARRGATLDDVVKCTVFLADMKDWPAFNDIYRTFFPRHFPTRSALGANGLARGAKVEVECTAASPGSAP